MSETLGGIYNPQAMPESEFLARYSVRLELTDKLLRAILSSGPDDEPTHAIIQGQRGQGKTSLLRRIQISLRDNPETRDWLLPLLFKEELYGVTSLCRLWEEAASLLSDTPGFECLAEAMEAFWETPHYEKDCYLILDRALADRDARLVLLIDNIGDLFAKLKRPEQQRLREILHTTKRIQIIGASTLMLEQHYDHGAPFYQFFREINLTGLSQDEALMLLRHLGTPEQQARLAEVIARTPGRIETLRRLTAGVPRTLVLLFEILLDQDGSAFRDLELLLDRVTPLYKHRMDDLPPQQQAIVDAVALGWDALSAGEIARATRIPSKQVAAQLKQLERANVIHREPTSTKNNLYRLAERFFNIWYLMRHGRPGDRRRALWLVRFLEIWCSPEDLRDRAVDHLCRLAKVRIAPDHAWLMTEALREVGLDLDTEDQLVKATREYLPLDEKSRVEPSIAETVDDIERHWPAEFLPLFDRDGMASMGGTELREYVKRFAAILAGLEVLMNEQDRLVEEFNRLFFRGEIDASLLALEQYERASESLGMEDYPGLVQSWRARSDWAEGIRDSLNRFRGLQSRLFGEDSRLASAVLCVGAQRYSQAFENLESSLPSLDVDAAARGIALLLTMLLSAEQTAYVRRLFEDEAFATYRFKDRFKPHYFALLAELGESRADDLKRMGPELVQTVEEIRADVLDLRTSWDKLPTLNDRAR